MTNNGKATGKRIKVYGKILNNKCKPITNAVIFFVMDVSGSMTKRKKFLARSFMFLLYQFIRYRYNTVETVFISHTTEAKEVSADHLMKLYQEYKAK